VAEAGGGKRSPRNVQGHTSSTWRPPIRIPPPEQLEAAAAILEGKKRIAILAGAGARGAGHELEEVAEKLGAPIIKAMLGKDCVPDNSP
jgi:pyruvate dehydrogenase (quinone)/pyruvate oxidase